MAKENISLKETLSREGLKAKDPELIPKLKKKIEDLIKQNKNFIKDIEEVTSEVVRLKLRLAREGISSNESERVMITQKLDLKFLTLLSNNKKLNHDI